jgi:hypothetical protein
MERATRHLELSIEIDSEPISGSIINGHQRSLPFTGWIELVAAIEAVRSASKIGPESLGLLPGAKTSEP